MLCVSMCGTTKMFHFDRSPFIPYMPIVLFNNGWIAADSCSNGVHALVEFEVPIDEVNPGFGKYEKVGLWLESRFPHKAEHVRIAGPLPRQILNYQSYDISRLMNRTGPPEEEYWVYVIQAQFNLGLLPKHGDAIYLLYESRLISFLWK